MSLANTIIPKEVIDKIDTPEVAEKLRNLISVLSITRSAEIDTEYFKIKAWTVKDKSGYRAVCIQIEEG